MVKKKVGNLYTPDRFFFFFLFIEIMTKFNKDLYAKMKAKKNEPLSNIGQRRLKITDKEREKEKESVKRGLSTLTLDEGQVTSPTISIEEVDPPTKKRKTGEKAKEKMCSNAWTDAGAAMARANELLTPEEMREISSVPSHEIVSQHVHKLMQVASSLCCCYIYIYIYLSTCSNCDETFCQVLGEMMHIGSQYLANEEKAVMANSKVEVLEAEASRLRKDLIAAMDVNNTSIEQIKSLTEQLESEKLLVKQKDELIASLG